MEELKNSSKERAMTPLAFNFMRVVMTIFKKFRNIEKEINFAGIENGYSVLDFGCGLGFDTILSAKKVGENGRIFALDISRQAIEIVEKKVSRDRLSNVDIILSGCDTGLKDSSIDLVYLHNTLPMVKNKAKVISEITRVLKVGGRLSYMSGAGSKIYGKGNISNSKLKEMLSGDFKFLKEKNGHIVFEKR